MALDKNYEEILGQGEVYLGYGQLDKAEECFRQVLEIEATNWFALNKLGVICGRKGEYDQALANFAKAMKEAPEKAGINCNIGNIYLQQKLYDKAIEYYLKAAEDNQESYIPIKNLAIAYKQKGKIKEYLKYTKKARILEQKEAKEKGYPSNFAHLMSLINKKEGIPITFLFLLVVIIIILAVLFLAK